MPDSDDTRKLSQVAHIQSITGNKFPPNCDSINTFMRSVTFYRKCFHFYNLFVTINKAFGVTIRDTGSNMQTHLIDL